MPPRIAFEPRGEAAPGSRLGATAAHRRARAAWGRRQPAIVSSHRLNYAHLDPTWAETGRGALRDLLGMLARDGAIFLTDAEARSLHEHTWSLRALTDRTSLLRCYGEPRSPVRIPAPAGAVGSALRAARDEGARSALLAIEAGELVARLDPGEYVVDWRFE